MKGRLKFRRPFVVLDKKKTGGENFLQKVFSPRPPLSKTFDVIESLFIAFLILTASGSPPDFFVGKEMLILFARFLRIEAFTPFQSQTKRQDPSFSSGCHFEKTANRDSIRGKVFEGGGGGLEGAGETFSSKFPPPPPNIPNALPGRFPQGAKAAEHIRQHVFKQALRIAGSGGKHEGA